MTRLSSYSVYFVVGLVPALIVFALFLTLVDKESPYSMLIFLPVLIFGIFILYHSKRVYYKGSELYLYDLFSKKFITITREMLGSIEKRNTSLFIDTGTYIVNYVDNENNAKYVYFAINTWLDNPDEIIEKLNSIDVLLKKDEKS